MNHGFKLHTDGTLEITIPKGVKVGRVFVCETGTQEGALYYREGDVPYTNGGDMISRHGVSAWLDNLGYGKLADYVMDEDRFPSAQPKQGGMDGHRNRKRMELRRISYNSCMLKLRLYGGVSKKKRLLP